MLKRIFIMVLILIIILPFSFSENMKVEDSFHIHLDSIIVDAHNDTMMKIVDDDTWLPYMDIGHESTNQIDINKMRAGNLSVGFFAAYSSAYYGRETRSTSRTLALINALYASERNNPHIIKIASNFKDIESGVLDGKIVAVPTIEGAYSLTKENAIELLGQYKDLKVKAIGFTWNYSNQLAEGTYKAFADANGTPSPAGLTDLGIQVLEEMNSLGMIIDVSHLSVDSFFDVVKHSKAPIIASHSGVYSIKAHTRNLTDNQLLAIKENGGLVGVVLYPEFLGEDGNVYISDFVDHVDYIVDLIGIDHVGLGSDFDGATMPNDLEDVSDIYKITDELYRRGYSRQDIQKFLGKNTLKLIKEVEYLGKDKNESSIKILSEINMGDMISPDKRDFTARVEEPSSLKLDSIRVILNGIEKTSTFDESQGIISMKINEPLKEKFNVLTFEVKDKDDLIKRETLIFYVNM